MKIEDLRETAALAHLNLDDKALAASFPAFEQMLGFFAAMQSADEDTAAFAAPIATLSGSGRTVPAAYFRPDAPDDDINHVLGSSNLNETMLNSAGEQDGQFVVVPNVL
ncbi:MAG: aspartyl/glutamyl-tRNA amidotransferase subunit C [Treponema sp.]|jgi:aspartyl-tRNA(Asn)/glutamyl-tRNA(Gln) amidotransferase subunit C|nr:aspartyl/glutamyl-tRNA amidotransferase subunit C [Treponema sp.]